MPSKQGGIKVCCRCGQSKSVTEFDKSRGRKDGLTYQCKLCRKEYNSKYTQSEHGRLIRKKWAKSHRRERKASELKHYYGLTLVEFDRMYIAQQGCCAICGKHQTKLSRVLCVDHNHRTKKIRGLLCTNCNTALGLLYDDPDLLGKAIIYLRNS